MTSRELSYESKQTIGKIGSIEDPKTTLERCAANVNDFIGYIEELYQDCRDQGIDLISEPIFKLAINVILSYTPLDFLETMIQNSNQYWEEIYNKDEKFFDENIDSIFARSGIEQNKIGIFKSLMKAKNDDGELIIDQKERDLIWRYMHSFVRLCLNHIHERRGPKVQITVNERDRIMTNSEGKEMKVPIYTAHYMDDIDLGKFFNLYGREVKNCKRVFNQKYYVNTEGRPVQPIER